VTYPCARACEGDDDQDVAGDETEIYTPDALLSNPKSVKQKMSDRSLSLYVCECVRARACVRMRKFVLMCAGRCVCERDSERMRVLTVVHVSQTYLRIRLSVCFRLYCQIWTLICTWWRQCP